MVWVSDPRLRTSHGQLQVEVDLTFVPNVIVVEEDRVNLKVKTPFIYLFTPSYERTTLLFELEIFALQCNYSFRNCWANATLIEIIDNNVGSLVNLIRA